MSRAAAFRDRVRYDADGGSSDAATGQRTSVATELCTRATSVQSAAGGDYAMARSLYPNAQWILELRYDRIAATISATHTATWLGRDRVFRVLGPAIDPDGRRRRLHVPAIETFPVRLAADR